MSSSSISFADPFGIAPLRTSIMNGLITASRRSCTASNGSSAGPGFGGFAIGNVLRDSLDSGTIAGRGRASSPALEGARA
ncbi:MAG: hypothetical protein JWL91_2159 [Sphingomonas bacterium]|nr:hypothetical protein [Sphingomonas bacterium]